jgi:hypothetical protein
MDDAIAQPASAGQQAEATEQLALKDYLDLYKVYRAYVMEESGLINARLMWIIVSAVLIPPFGLPPVL